MPSDLGQKTGCEKAENLRLQRKEGRRGVVLACNLHITSNIDICSKFKLWILTCNQYNIECF